MGCPLYCVASKTQSIGGIVSFLTLGNCQWVFANISSGTTSPQPCRTLHRLHYSLMGHPPSLQAALKVLFSSCKAPAEFLGTIFHSSVLSLPRVCCLSYRGFLKCQRTWFSFPPFLISSLSASSSAGFVCKSVSLAGRSMFVSVLESPKHTYLSLSRLLYKISFI